MNYLKVLDDETTDDNLVIEGYIAVYGGKDLTGEHFTADTNFESAYTRKNSILIDWEHGMEPDKVKNQPGRDDILGKVEWTTAVSDDIGLLARHVLDRREKYVSQFIEPLARAELLGSSSEATPKGIQKTATGEITRWPLKRQSFTVTPAEPRLLTDNQLRVIKSLSNEYPQLKSLLQGGQETAANGEADNNNNGDKAMEQNEIQALIDNAVKTALSSQTPPDVEAIAAKVAESVNAQTAEQVKAYMAELDKTIQPKKAGVVIVEDETDKQVKALTPEHRFGLQLQAVKHLTTGGGYTNLSNHQKAILGQNESVPQDGGFLVGTEQENVLDKKMHDSAVFASRANNRTIGSGANSVDFYGVKENSRVAGSRFGGIQGYRVAEGQTITASSMDFYKYNLKPEKYAVLAYATSEVLRDAALLGTEISEAAGMELAFMVDDDMMNGTAAGYPAGILSAACLVSVAKETGQVAATVVAENIIKMWARLWSRSRANAVWFINQDVLPQLHQLQLPVGTGGALVYMPPGGLSSSPYGSLYGRPVVDTEFNQTLGTVGDIVLADWSQYKLANMGGVRAASSMHVQFLTDQMAFRFTVEYDGQATWEAALTPANGTNTQSPFIALATRS